MTTNRAKRPHGLLLIAVGYALTGCPQPLAPNGVPDVGLAFEPPEPVVPSCDQSTALEFSAHGFATVRVLCDPTAESGALFALKALNESGQFLAGNGPFPGFFEDPSLLVSNHEVINIGDMVPTDINSIGLVCGYLTAEFPSDDRAVVWENGIRTELGALPGGQKSRALSVNDASIVVGMASDVPTLFIPTAPPPRTYPVKWERIDGRWQISRLQGTSSGGVLSTTIAAEAVAVNNHEQMALGGDRLGLLEPRIRVFFWENGRIVDIGDLGGDELEATGINDDGWIVGWSLVTDFAPLDQDFVPPKHAFLWRDGEMIDLGTLGGKNSEALGIDGFGRVVGISDTGEFAPRDCPQCSLNPIRRPFLWHNGVMTSLQDVVPPDSQLSLRRVADITHDGRILGVAHTDQDDAVVIMMILPD